MQKISRRNLLIAGGSTAALLGVGASIGSGAASAADPPLPGAETVVEWNKTLLRIVRTPNAQPATIHTTRSFAMMHAAIYDAVAAIRGGHPYLFEVSGSPRASAAAAAAQAAHDTLRALYPAMADDLGRQLDASLAAVADPNAGLEGARVGALTAKLILALRANDGSDAVPPNLADGTEPGQYRAAPPLFAPATFTHWAKVTPFVIHRADQFRPDAYPALTSATYGQAINEVQSLGQDKSLRRTEDQTIMARFWAAPIQNYWNEIAQSTVEAHRVDLLRAAHVFAELNLAIADAAIAFYEAKYHFLIWRPVTAIRNDDTNPDTSTDVQWTPLANTPSDPSYPGAHSVISQAGAIVLDHHFSDPGHITVTSETLPDKVRTFNSFQDVADEAGFSRVVAGVHTRLDHSSGERLGLAIARLVLNERTGMTAPV
jgi:hypothetical protein